MLTEEMNLVFYTFDADFRSFEEGHKAGVGEEVAETVCFLLCDPHYKVRRQRELKNIGRDVLEPKDIDDFHDLPKILVVPAGRGFLFCSALHYSLWYQRSYSLTTVSNDEETEKAKINEENLFEMEQTPLLYTRPTGHHQQEEPSKRVSQKFVVKRAVHFWRKRLSFSDAIHNVDHDAYEEMISTDRGWINLMSDISGPP